MQQAMQDNAPDSPPHLLQGTGVQALQVHPPQHPLAMCCCCSGWQQPRQRLLQLQALHSSQRQALAVLLQQGTPGGCGFFAATCRGMVHLANRQGNQIAVYFPGQCAVVAGGFQA